MNTYRPERDVQPDGRRLFRSTLIAAAVALVLLVTTVLPSEYGIDPTGIGSLLGLTDMGKIKVQLAREADREAARQAAGQADTDAPVSGPAEDRLQRIELKLNRIAEALSVAAPPAARKARSPNPDSKDGAWKDQVSITLSPGQGVEIKLVMDKGARAWFEWTANGSRLNFDTHGDGSDRNVNYKKGRGVAGDKGILTAAFTGNHGWFWRNRTQTDVTLTLKTRGEYVKLKRTA